jgi:hypothetical protein
VIGSAIRRSLRARNLRDRIQRLTQDIDTLVVRLLKRLPRGLTRRRSIIARLELLVAKRESALPALPALPCATDTS